MGVGGQEDLDILEFETQGFYVFADHGVGAGQAGIDQDIACGGGYEIAGQVIGPNVIEVAGDTKGGKILDPFRLEVGERG
jgi:hypothetical protein